MTKVDQKSIYEARKKQTTAVGSSNDDRGSSEGELSADTRSDTAKIYASRRLQQDK